MSTINTKPLTERRPGPEPAGRTCAEDGCTTLLSTYNCGDHCAQHGGWPKDTVRPIQTVDDLADVMAA